MTGKNNKKVAASESGSHPVSSAAMTTAITLQ
jgi:hypothetical protein